MYMLRPRNKICKINYFQFFIKSNYIHLSASIKEPIIKTIETKCKILGKIKGVIMLHITHGILLQGFRFLQRYYIK